ncbi:alpha-(1,3)-fucosyltransferase 7-like [Nerophis lumbriciformis]|uniref:alpha-(1,3)-fucosyltransferase 7-like n=1 Tax=Nerophis lumbriciformis TaxID=546530 RepID=UPI002ADFBFD9|nr:alpha-(1,3)-fucosyltransferase 7-like [Nerophis lumbriciformis]
MPFFGTYVKMLQCNHIKKATLQLFLCFLCILGILCVSMLSLHYDWLRESSFLAASSSKKSKQHNVTILQWHWPYDKVLNFTQDICWKDFGIPNCRVVTQRSLFSEADVVVFFNRELRINKEKLPLELPRPPGQRWAWMTMEASVRNGDRRRFAGLFNLTVNFRRDADVSIPYGRLLPQDSKTPMENIQWKKTDLVCWVVRNYQESYKRSQVYKELSAVVRVKVYGLWANVPLAPKDLLPTLSRCYFYLAFENTIAKDYISEKLWRNAYQSGAVPVVLGASVQDYEAVAPPHSFIHVDQFASVKELGEYLQQLAGDVKHYREYLQWRREWKVELHNNLKWRLCQICLRYPSFPPHKVYDDLEAWDNVV